MDANIKSVNELSLLTSVLQGAQETIVADCTSIANLMDQKLADLLALRSRAENTVKEFEEEYYDAFDRYSDTVSNTRGLSNIQQNLRDLGRRKQEADYMLGQITQAVVTCQGLVSSIVQETNSFKNDAFGTIGAGRNYVRKSSNDLIGYLEHSQKK